ncbi:MAG: riboflavin synthase [Candidatus Melainabacteria bacterium]|nr:riboflavin synthase [Candidatus Melainabacteria bacterium]
MFTGLIQALGTVCQLAPLNEGLLVGVEAPLASLSHPLALGDSIALNGCCTTVIRLEGDAFFVELSKETLSKTAFSGLKLGQRLNLELPIAPTTPLGGHYVTGHVDCVLPLVSSEVVGICWVLTFALPERQDFQGLLVEKGSVAIDGISLTVNTVDSTGFTVCIIPHTMNHTTLGDLPVDGLVQVEFDILGKYVQRLLQVQGNVPTASTPQT